MDDDVCESCNEEFDVGVLEGGGKNGKFFFLKRSPK